MNFLSIFKKISKGEWHYAFGRFETVRRAHSILQGSVRRLPGKAESVHTLFPTTLDSKSLEDLKSDAVTFGLQLPLKMVDEIYRYANVSPGIRKSDGTPFQYKEVIGGRLRDGSPIVLGTIVDAENCPAVVKIMNDPGLLYLISSYLGYPVRSVKPWLFWSFVTPISTSDRLKGGQTVLFHYDVDGLNFAYASFYLTDVDASSGAHVMVKKSHKGKSLGMLFHSANQTDEVVVGRYGKENLITIEGLAGTGFIQDASCYHKALAPEKKERLMLQIRFN